MKIRFRPYAVGHYVDHRIRNYSGDPIIRDWPALPPEGAHLEFDIGEEEPLMGNVRGYTFADPVPGDTEPMIEVRFS